MSLKGSNCVGQFQPPIRLAGYRVAIPRSPFTFLLPLTVLLLALIQSGCAGYTSADPAPSIISQPVSQTVTVGQTATFSVAASGTAPLSYQWKKNGTAIGGATSSSYTTPAETTSDSGAQFTVVVSNSAGTATSSAALLTVNAAPPSITTQPTSQTVTAGQTATFSVVASGTAPLSYQWQKNGTAVSGATSSSYTTPAETTSDSGAQFTVLVSNSAGSATSSAAMLTVIAVVATGPAQTPVLNVSVPPAVNQGSTYQFSCVSNCGTGGTWSVSGTNASGGSTSAAGSINSSSGVYTAPSTVASQQSVFGCQLLPNNHIINTNISSLSVNSNSTTWVTALGSAGMAIYPQTPLNITNNSTPTQAMVFQYSPHENGTFQPATYPLGQIQNGWLTAFNGSYYPVDEHLFQGNYQTCVFSEIYAPWATGANTSAPTTNGEGGVQYSASSYVLPVTPGDAGADAAGMQMIPMQLHLQEIENAVANSTPITHAFRITVSPGALGTGTLWPAPTPYVGGAGSIPLGARIRLKSSVNISSFSAGAQAILTALKNYGAFVDDGGSYGQGIAVTADCGQWPDAYVDVYIPGVFTEIDNAGLPPSDFEFVDESSLELSSSSGECTCNREVVTYTSSAGTASVDVVLTGVTMNLPLDAITIQAGAPAQTLAAYIGGTSNIGVTWAMNPSTSAYGTLNSNTGLYTPPASLSTTSESTVVTATSSANSAVKAIMTINILPNTPPTVYLFSGYQTLFVNQGHTWPYVDGSGHTWNTLNGAVGSNGSISVAFDCAYPPWPVSLLNAELYCTTAANIGNTDIVYDIIVPNGIYNVHEKFGNGYYTASGTSKFSLEYPLGTVTNANLDLYTAAGCQYCTVDYVTTMVVTNNHLKFAVRDIATGSQQFTGLSALEIDLNPSLGSSISPSVTLSKQMTIH